MTPMAPVTYLGSLLPVNLGPVPPGAAAHLTVQTDVTGVATGSRVLLSVKGTSTDPSGNLANFTGVIAVRLIGP